MIDININHEISTNRIQMQEIMEEMTKTIIRTPTGRELVIEWQEQDTSYQVNQILNEVFDYQIPTKETNNEIEEHIEESTNNVNTNEVHNIEVPINNLQDKITQDNIGSESTKDSLLQINNEQEYTSNEETIKQQEVVANHKTINIKTKTNEVILQTKYFLSTANALYLQTYVGGKIQKDGKWINANETEIETYFLPNETNINKYKYQFLSLEKTAGISEADAANYLKNKGILKGKEAIFLEAAKEHNINEIYLMAHACLETGNGTSELAKGVSYKGQTVYNMFGIGAYDNQAVTKGAEYAYKAGWTTPEKAIQGGAKFISENYINNSIYKQDTLYEMRWNPGSPGSHQYATDVAWATKQAVWIEKIYDCFDNPEITFDIPIYLAD